jgi:hypothetical protein
MDGSFNFEYVTPIYHSLQGPLYMTKNKVKKNTKKMPIAEKTFKHEFNSFKSLDFVTQCTQAGVITTIMPRYEQIDKIEFCLGVGIRTLQRWIAGVAEPHPCALRLLFNMTKGINQIGPWAGWRLNGEHLVSRTNESITPDIMGKLWLWRNDKITLQNKIADLNRLLAESEAKTRPIDRDKLIEAVTLLDEALANQTSNERLKA